MKEFIKNHPWLMALVVVTFVGLLISSIWTGQHFLIVLPLFNSLVIMILTSSINRYGQLLGAVNSLVYGGVYFYFGLYGIATSTILVNAPIMFITFILWNKKAYKHSTVLKKLSVKQRGIGFILFLCLMVGSFVVLKFINPEGHILLDTVISVLGYVIAFLMMFAFVEAYPLNVISCLLNLILFAVMTTEDIKQLPYFIFSLYSTIMTVRAYFCSKRLYAEQQDKNC